MKMNTKIGKIAVERKGFTLIELIVAIFLFSMIMVSLVSVFVSTLNAYGKARVMKTIKESTEFAMNSIAKDVRMGKIESADGSINTGDSFTVIRNRDQLEVCYKKTTYMLAECDSACNNCNGSILDLTGTGMKFDMATSCFRYQRTDPPAPSIPTVRGWVEMNFDIIPDSAGGEADVSMNTDIIHVQTMVSSRDYGWEDAIP